MTTTASRGELPIIQATMDRIQWFVPLLNRLPRDHRFALGDRLVAGLYDLLEGLVTARYATAKLEQLEPLNARLDLLRLQIRLLHRFPLIDERRYEPVARLVEEVGCPPGLWPIPAIAAPPVCSSSLCLHTASSWGSPMVPVR